MNIKAVIFDLGGVLLDIDWRRYEQEKQPGAQLENAWLSYEQLNAELMQFVASLRPLFLVATICNGGSREAMNRKFKFSEQVDLMVFDSEEGVSKPDPLIYQRTLARLGVQPEEAIFIDDKERNVEAARLLGMHGVVYKNTAQTIVDVQTILSPAHTIYEQDNIYQALIQEIVAEERQQADIIGGLLIGSFARREAIAGSDLDLRFILAPGKRRSVLPHFRHGVWLECGYADVPTALAKLENNPIQFYAYLDGQILFDPEGAITQLTQRARELFAAYQYSQAERKEIAYWLRSVQRKLYAAYKAGDLSKAAYVSSTASWPILRGLWAANSKPVPPNGALWFHLKDLARGPENVEELLRIFFSGEMQQRIQIALELIEWILAHLEE